MEVSSKIDLHSNKNLNRSLSLNKSLSLSNLNEQNNLLKNFYLSMKDLSKQSINNYDWYLFNKKYENKIKINLIRNNLIKLNYLHKKTLPSIKEKDSTNSINVNDSFFNHPDESLANYLKLNQLSFKNTQQIFRFDKNTTTQLLLCYNQNKHSQQLSKFSKIKNTQQLPNFNQNENNQQLFNYNQKSNIKEISCFKNMNTEQISNYNQISITQKISSYNQNINNEQLFLHNQNSNNKQCSINNQKSNTELNSTNYIKSNSNQLSTKNQKKNTKHLSTNNKSLDNQKLSCYNQNSNNVLLSTYEKNLNNKKLSVYKQNKLSSNIRLLNNIELSANKLIDKQKRTYKKNQKISEKHRKIEELPCSKYVKNDNLNYKKIVLIKTKNTDNTRRSTVMSLKGAFTMNKHYYPEDKKWAYLICLCTIYIHLLIFLLSLNGIHLVVGQFLLEKRIIFLKSSNFNYFNCLNKKNVEILIKSILYNLDQVFYNEKFEKNNTLFDFDYYLKPINKDKKDEKYLKNRNHLNHPYFNQPELKQLISFFDKKFSFKFFFQKKSNFKLKLKKFISLIKIKDNVFTFNYLKKTLKNNQESDNINQIIRCSVDILNKFLLKTNQIKFQIVMTRSNIIKQKKQYTSTISNSSNSSLPLIDEKFIKKQLSSKNLFQYYLPNDVYLTKINQTKRLNISNSLKKKPKKYFFTNKKYRTRFTKFQKPPEDVIPSPSIKLINQSQEFFKNKFEDKSYLEKVPNYLLYINSMQNFEVPNFKTNQFEKLKVHKHLKDYKEFQNYNNLGKYKDFKNYLDKNLENNSFNVSNRLKELNKNSIMLNEDSSSSIDEIESIGFEYKNDQAKLNHINYDLVKPDQFNYDQTKLNKINYNNYMPFPNKFDQNKYEQIKSNQTTFNQMNLNELNLNQNNYNKINNFNKVNNSYLNKQALRENSIISDCSQMIVSKSIEFDSELENVSLDEKSNFNEKKFDENFSKNFQQTNNQIFDTKVENILETIEPDTIKEELIKRSINFYPSYTLNLNKKDYYKPNYSNKINLKINDLEQINDKTNFKFKESIRKNCLHKFDPILQKQSEMQKNFLITIKKHYYPEYENIWSFVVLTCVTLIYSIQNIFQIEHLFIIDSSVYFKSSLSLSVFCGAISSCVSFFLAPFVISLCKHKSSRLIALLGSIMCFLGLLFTSFATLPGQLLFAYPFFFGIGSSLLRESSLMILSKYYKRRRLLVEMIVKFFSYLLYGFLPITLSYVINIKNWRYGLQSYSIMFLVCFFLCILMRPASLYHPQRRAILHLKNLQKRNKIKRKQSEQIEKNIFSSTSLIIKNLRNSLNFVDYSTLRSRTVQLLLCSFCLLSFGLFTPIFVLLPTLFIEYNYNIISLYYIQLVFGLSGCLSPILIYCLFRKTETKTSFQKTKIDIIDLKKNSKQNFIFNPLFLIKLSCFSLTLLQLSLINLNFENFITLSIIMALYAFFFSLLFTSLKVFVLRKVRAKSVCSLWAWFQLSQSIPLLTGVTFSAFLNDNFNYNVGTYFSSFCCFIGFLTLFSIDIHRKLNKKHIENYLKDAQNTKLWSTNLFNEKQSKNILSQMTHSFCDNLPSKEILFKNDKKYFGAEEHNSKYHKINYCFNKNFFSNRKVNKKKNVSKKNSLNFFENSHQLKNYKNDDSILKFSLDSLLINNSKTITDIKTKKFFSLPEISKNLNENETKFLKDKETTLNKLDDEVYLNFDKQSINLKSKKNYFDDKDYLSSSEKSSNYELNMESLNDNYFFNSLDDFDENKIQNENICSNFEIDENKQNSSKCENIKKLNEEILTKKIKDKIVNNDYLGQFVCEDYQSLVESLIKSKKEGKHEDDCIVVNLVQEILKQITIKNLSEDFNQTSQCNSSNNSNEIKTKSNSLKSNDIYLELNNFDPSKLKAFQKCSSNNKCLNCDKTIP